MKVDSIGKRISRFFDELGIDTAVCIVRDPDSSDCVTVKRGERVWLMGATEGVRQELIHNWIDVPRLPD